MICWEGERFLLGKINSVVFIPMFKDQFLYRLCKVRWWYLMRILNGLLLLFSKYCECDLLMSLKVFGLVVCMAVGTYKMSFISIIWYCTLKLKNKKQKININYFLFKLVWHENPWNIREDWMNFMKHWNFISLTLTSTCLVGYKRHIPVGRFYCIVAKWYSTSQNMSKGIISLNCDSKAEKEGMYN